MFSPESTSDFLTASDYGIRPEGVPVQPYWFDIPVAGDRLVHVHTLIWERHQDKMFLRSIADRPPLPYQQDGQLVVMSGFATNARDWPTVYHSAGEFWPTVVGIDHPEAPTSEILPPERPFNEDSFAHTGAVTLRAIENLTSLHILKPGAIDLLAFSTGGPALIEAAALDERETASGLHERLIRSLTVISPGGIIDHPDFASIQRGATSALGPALGQFFHDQYLITRSHITHEPKFLYPQETGMLTDLRQYLVRLWPNQRPLLLPETPSVKSAQSLIYRNVTEECRTALTATPVHLILIQGDRVFPPDRLLHQEDNRIISESTDPEAARLDCIVRNAKCLFPNTRTHVSVISGGHHLLPKTDAIQLLILAAARLSEGE